MGARFLVWCSMPINSMWLGVVADLYSVPFALEVGGLARALCLNNSYIDTTSSKVGEGARDLIFPQTINGLVRVIENIAVISAARAGLGSF